MQGRLGGVAERRGNGLQSRVHGFKSRLHLGESQGRLAQRERASLTRKRSLVRSQYRPPAIPAGQVARYRSSGNGFSAFLVLTVGAFWEHRPLPGGDNFRFLIVLLPGEHFLISKVVTAERGAVLLPAGLQAVDEPLFDGAADVAVDPAGPRQPVAEPFGLGGLGDAVLDEPGFVAVAQVVVVPTSAQA